MLGRNKPGYQQAETGRRSIRKANAELEQRVQERTAELTEALQTLRQTGAYTRSLIEASLDPLVTIGRDGTITDVNAATETATGRVRQELIGTDFSTYFTEPEKARTGYLQVFRDGIGPRLPTGNPPPRRAHDSGVV